MTERAERKYVTVMFADISGFTAMSEKLDPETVRGLINACFEHLVAQIKRYDGYIDKFIIAMKLWLSLGPPWPTKTTLNGALRAALDMMLALEDFNTEFADQIPQPLALHFGLNERFSHCGWHWHARASRL